MGISNSTVFTHQYREGEDGNLYTWDAKKRRYVICSVPRGKPLQLKSEGQVGGTHYKKFKIEPGFFCQHNSLPHFESNVIKYVCRHTFKDGVKDIDKAIDYLNKIKELYYGD